MLNQPLSCVLPSTAATWLWKYSPLGQHLFVPADVLSWDFYHVSVGRQQSLNHLYHHGDTVPSLPVDARAATVPLQGQHACLLSVGLDLAPLPNAEHRLTFSQTLDALPASSSWAIQESAFPPDLCPIIASLQDGSAPAVSDGSSKDKFGISAFTIVDKNR